MLHVIVMSCHFDLEFAMLLLGHVLFLSPAYVMLGVNIVMSFHFLVFQMSYKLTFHLHFHAYSHGTT